MNTCSMLAELDEVKAGNSVEDPSSIKYETINPAKYFNRKVTMQNIF